MTSANHCAHCGTPVRDPGGRRVWTVFCSPEHALAWQDARTEEQIEKEASGPEGNDVCQWCRSPLRSGYHETGCPVCALVETREEGTSCTHPPETILCGPLYADGELLPIDRRPQNIREQEERRTQWCSLCGASRWYPDQPWALPEARKAKGATP